MTWRQKSRKSWSFFELREMFGPKIGVAYRNTDDGEHVNNHGSSTRSLVAAIPSIPDEEEGKEEKQEGLPLSLSLSLKEEEREGNW